MLKSLRWDQLLVQHVLMGVLFFREKLGVWTVLGMAMVLAAAVLLARGETRDGKT